MRMFQQDNAKPHTARKAMNKFQELDGIDVLPYPTYSPDFDYYFIKGRRFVSFDDIEEACQDYCNSKPKE